MRPPKKTFMPTGSAKMKYPPIEEIIGSPRGTAATVVALRVFTRK